MTRGENLLAEARTLLCTCGAEQSDEGHTIWCKWSEELGRLYGHVQRRTDGKAPPPANTRGERETIEKCAQIAEGLGKMLKAMNPNVGAAELSACWAIAQGIRALAEDGPPTKEGLGAPTSR